jgi:16S rRNA (adenine1518-N6/adenine1519-N6)-dimethyltransferase
VRPKKSLGQHWLHDDDALNAMLAAGEVTLEDTVVEVGPGLGTLTQKLAHNVKQVMAVELDEKLAEDLKLKNLSNVEVASQDILTYNFSKLPKGYKVIANIPYYLTSKLLRNLLEANNPPSVIALLIQKEVAERIVANPGEMSILAVSVQFYAEAKLREVVPTQLFTPPPKVDSQIIQIKRRQTPLFIDVDTDKFFRIVKAGFSEKRKKLRSSLSGGMQLEKTVVDEWLTRAGIPETARAQELTLEQWNVLYKTYRQNT